MKHRLQLVAAAVVAAAFALPLRAEPPTGWRNDGSGTFPNLSDLRIFKRPTAPRFAGLSGSLRPADDQEMAYLDRVIGSLAAHADRQGLP
jgi:hypothetical protein